MVKDFRVRFVDDRASFSEALTKLFKP